MAKDTVFIDKHRELGAKVMEFAGFNMPIEYSGIKDEHMTVREGVGVFDVSHMGEVWIKGENALQFIQNITTNDASKLKIGEAQYSCMPNGKGGIVDDLLVYYFEENKYLLVINASNIDKDYEWMLSNSIDGVVIENASDNISQLAIQGPKATELLQKLTDIDLSEIKYYTFTTGKFAGIDNVIISATGYTGSGGFELYFYNSDGKAIWDAIFTEGEDMGIKPIGLAARDTLRLEKGYCLYGNDIDDTTSPLEAGLGWITKFVDGKDFVDRDKMELIKEHGVSKRLRGFKMIDRGIPRHGYEICNSEGTVIGVVTSGTQSPMLNCGVGMGYISVPECKFGSEVYIKVRKKMLKAEVVKLPFV